ncbi:MAG: hypothetical protein HXS41_01305 [Theionarchaea archaeon]|nr:hypothetical protein [Theionarchaea archaeon]MBU6999210.1 hypothetical protein [Theionarchaea archaeon]MBU7019665.1 hypothetical protein [Theionarchaea archaeon]MBU7034586.1 hypothetical protein [Theionarchaea archaeon]MBU7041311.1 hypothetical protein [Theionarchaea archaeon]
MKLLDYIGKWPELTNKELAHLLNLKNSPYVSTLKRILHDKEYFIGPYYQTDYGRIFRNRVRKAIAILLFEQSYKFMVSLLRNIGCFSYMYPIEERFFKRIMISIFDSDTEGVKKLFDFLKEEGIIFHYELYVQDHQTYVIPPVFLGDSEEASFVPPLENLLDDVDIPDLSFGHFEDLQLSVREQELITCFEQGNNVLTDVMEQEKGQGNFYTYAEWKEAKTLLTERKILQPVYDIFPLSYWKCSHFFLLVRTPECSVTKRILLNFGKNSRLYKKIFLWTSYQTGRMYGVIYCISHPEFTIKLLNQLDKYELIEDEQLFVLRKTISLWGGQSISMDHYDPEHQTLCFPYTDYLERMERVLEEPQCQIL